MCLQIHVQVHHTKLTPPKKKEKKNDEVQKIKTFQDSFQQDVAALTFSIADGEKRKLKYMWGKTIGGDKGIFRPKFLTKCEIIPGFALTCDN